MPLLKNFYRSELPNLAHTKRLLNKIAALLAQSPRHVVFQKGSFRANASLLAQVAIDETLGSANITFQQAPFSAVASSKVIQDLTYTAVASGAGGDAISIHYTTGATAGAEAVSVVGNAITVQIATGVSTATQVKAAVDGYPAAAALVTVAIASGQGSHAQTAPVVATNLTGGVTAGALESYDIADIHSINRIRTKKWLIRINDAANPA